MVLVFCTSHNCDLHLDEVSRTYLKRFLRYSADTSVWWEWPFLNNLRATTLNVGKQELRFMCSARHVMVFNIYVKFHENMSSGFKVMERTRNLLTDTHTQK